MFADVFKTHEAKLVLLSEELNDSEEEGEPTAAKLALRVVDMEWWNAQIGTLIRDLSFEDTQVYVRKEYSIDENKKLRFCWVLIINTTEGLGEEHVKRLGRFLGERRSAPTQKRDPVSPSSAHQETSVRKAPIKKVTTRSGDTIWTVPLPHRSDNRNVRTNEVNGPNKRPTRRAFAELSSDSDQPVVFETETR